jgi:hypothetical protein
MEMFMTEEAFAERIKQIADTCNGSYELFRARAKEFVDGVDLIGDDPAPGLEAQIDAVRFPDVDDINVILEKVGQIATDAKAPAP